MGDLRTQAVIVLATLLIGILAGHFLWPDQPTAPTSKNVSKPENLKDGQCAVQVYEGRGALFEQMKETCRVLVVLDGNGRITEIIEN